MKLNLIYCKNNYGVIGYNNDLLFNIPEDMKPEYTWNKKTEIKAVFNPGNNDPLININLNTGSLSIE